MDESPYAAKIRQVIQEETEEPIMIGDFVLLAECVTLDGAKSMYIGHNGDIPVWREIGMLEFRLEDIRAGGFALIASQLTDDEEEEHE